MEHLAKKPLSLLEHATDEGYNKHNNRELDFDLTFTYMPLTNQSKFNYLYNISTILERKNISRTVYEVVLSLQMTE